MIVIFFDYLNDRSQPFFVEITAFNWLTRRFPSDTVIDNFGSVKKPSFKINSKITESNDMQL